MRRLSLLPFCLFALVGCGGSGSNSSSTTPRYAGEYYGTWVNVADAEDHGVSSWTIGEDGTLSGSDVDVSQEFSYVVFGNVDAQGNVDGATSRIGEEEVIGLSGRFQFDNEGKLVGDLVWASNPPLTYRYTITRARSAAR